jgi:anaerobic magnesium-protoporphyrin IX monomethyl ester cyclase
MGEYMPPPLGILELAAYLEKRNNGCEIKVLDCQAEGLNWHGLESRIESFQPDIVAPSSLSTCNAYTTIRTVEVAKKLNPSTITVAGGQHFTATAQESLETYPELDVIVRGEGEETFTDLVKTIESKGHLSGVDGISFRHDGHIIHNPCRKPIENLDNLPLPGYHFVKDHMKKYHFTLYVGPNMHYALVEGSRGCDYRCTFCSQWRFWEGKFRSKSPKRIADEFEYCHREYGSQFLWLSDDNFGFGDRMDKLCDEIIRRGLADEILWFMQARSDDIITHQHILPKMRKAGNHWILTGLENNSPETLQGWRKAIKPSDSKTAMDLLKRNDIFSQGTFIIGERKDTHESLEAFRKFVDDVDPDIAIFMVLTPYPGTETYEVAKRNGWIEDTNWADYDMVHAIMPTETLSRREVQEELYKCYRSFYGSTNRRVRGLFSSNSFKRKTYRYVASQVVLTTLRNMF